jgi:hypothetical protein
MWTAPSDSSLGHGSTWASKTSPLWRAAICLWRWLELRRTICLLQLPVPMLHILHTSEELGLRVRMLWRGKVS